MLPKKLKRWIHIKKNGYRFVKSEIMRYPENGSGMFIFAKHEHFFSKSDNRGVLMRGYYTAPVSQEMDFESASFDSMSFKFKKKGGRTAVGKSYECVSHYVIAYDKMDDTRTEGTEWNFHDGSFIVELEAFPVSKTSPCPLCTVAV